MEGQTVHLWLNEYAHNVYYVKYLFWSLSSHHQTPLLRSEVLCRRTIFDLVIDKAYKNVLIGYCGWRKLTPEVSIARLEISHE